MDLTLTAEEAAFRDEARAWLAEHAPHAPTVGFDTAEGFAAHRAWERRLHDGGWGTVSWPTEYGGRGATLNQWLLFEQEYYAAGCPGRVNQNGLFLFAPTLMDFGTDDQKARWLPTMSSGDEIWAQGWSEPDAGSDMAAIRTKARLDGDDWVITGQKTWSTRAVWADWVFCLVRTDPDSERHRGLSFIVVPLDADGVEVRPIRQLDGLAGFAEIFFDEVRVPAESHTIGEVGQGWRVAMATAGFERGVSLRSPGRFTATAERLRRLSAAQGSELAPVLRRQVARAVVRAEQYELFVQQTVSRVVAGEEIGPESSLNKIFWSEMDREFHEIALALRGDAGGLLDDAPALSGLADESAWMDGFLFSLAGPIYAGTNEIQRNIIAERVLGLPRG